MWLDSYLYDIDLGVLLTNPGKSNINQQRNDVTKMTNMFSYVRKLANFLATVFVKGETLNIVDFVGHTVCPDCSTLSLSVKNSQSHCVKNWEGLCSNKILNI